MSLLATNLFAVQIALNQSMLIGNELAALGETSLTEMDDEEELDDV